MTTNAFLFSKRNAKACIEIKKEKTKTTVYLQPTLLSVQNTFKFLKKMIYNSQIRIA